MKSRIDQLGQATFTLEGEVVEMVTFLNKTLKDRGLIFGITRNEGETRYTLTVYLVVEEKSENRGKEV